jgi:hydrogenase maturation protein HypF
MAMTAPAQEGCAIGADARGDVIRIRGQVQGVGFRPAVWRLATACGLCGDVCNEGAGVLIRVWGPPRERERFLRRLRNQAPPLARIDAVDTAPAAGPAPSRRFSIAPSRAGGVSTGVLPDAATCSACLADMADRNDRRHRYAFTNCTHCGPRLSIVDSIPYDRVRTSMSDFSMCADCRAEYGDPHDRRFHAQPNACAVCGPKLVLEDANGAAVAGDPIDAACAMIESGAIVAVKGLGGFHLMADACNESAVHELRRRKRRDEKPFALMAPDVVTIRRFCSVDAEEQALLESPAAPIVLLDANGPERVAAAVAPHVSTLGFMLAYTPLHHLLMRSLQRPVVLTSGNVSDAPQCIGNDEARRRLAPLAGALLMHDRAIVNRIDDSVVRVAAGAGRVLRRGRGYAPAPRPRPPGFAAAPPRLAMGGELKNTFCLLDAGQAILSAHIGDLEDAATFGDYLRTLDRYRCLHRHRPAGFVIDAHPDYLPAKLGRELAEREGLRLVAAQHHHAHVASCLAENGVPLHAPPVLGIALDGLGFGDDGTFWGGEFLLADYRGYERLGHLRALPLIGGARAVREPWRSTYVHLSAALGWERFSAAYPSLELHAFLAGRPLRMLDAMVEHGINSVPASSCGRLFDAVAGAVGLCRARAGYEGQAAVELEASVDAAALDAAGDGYPFAIGSEPAELDSAPMWPGLLDDLARGTPTAAIAARFHVGLARALADFAAMLAGRAARRPDAVALSGGVFANRILLERVVVELCARGFAVLTHAAVPCNDGGLALGQAAIGAARALAAPQESEGSPCA